jgi:hypothetical protein
MGTGVGRDGWRRKRSAMAGALEAISSVRGTVRPRWWKRWAAPVEEIGGGGGRDRPRQWKRSVAVEEIGSRGRREGPRQWKSSMAAMEELGSCDGRARSLGWKSSAVEDIGSCGGRDRRQWKRSAVVEENDNGRHRRRPKRSTAAEEILDEPETPPVGDSLVQDIHSTDKASREEHRNANCERRTILDQDSVACVLDRLHNITNDYPHEFISNLDQTCWRLCEPPRRVFAEKGTEIVKLTSRTDEKSSFTAIATISVAGDEFPLWVLAKRKCD